MQVITWFRFRFSAFSFTSIVLVWCWQSRRLHSRSLCGNRSTVRENGRIHEGSLRHLMTPSFAFCICLRVSSSASLSLPLSLQLLFLSTCLSFCLYMSLSVCLLLCPRVRLLRYLFVQSTVCPSLISVCICLFTSLFSGVGIKAGYDIIRPIWFWFRSLLHSCFLIFRKRRRCQPWTKIMIHQHRLS